MFKVIINDNVNYMMGYGYNYGGMMGGVGTFGFVTWLVIIVDLVLLGVWLWKQITKKQ